MAARYWSASFVLAFLVCLWNPGRANGFHEHEHSHIRFREVNSNRTATGVAPGLVSADQRGKVSGDLSKKTQSVALKSVSLFPRKGLVGIGGTILISIVANSDGLSVADGACAVNKVDVSKSWHVHSTSPNGTPASAAPEYNYTLVYSVRENDASQPPGAVPISCVLQRGGEILRVFHFDDGNEISIDATRPKILRVGLLRLPYKIHLGVGSTISLEVEASPSDTHLRISECTVNFPSVTNPASAVLGANVTNFLNLGRGLYSMDYVIHKNDLNRNFMNEGGGMLPFACTFWDQANNSLVYGPVGLPMQNFIIDAHPPSVVSASIYHTSSSPARIGTNITIALVANEPSLLAGPTCVVDNADIASSFDSKRNEHLDPSKMTSFFSFTVAAGQGDWSPGRLPLDCSLMDAAGNVGGIKKFTDNNKLAGNTHSPTLADYLPGVSLALRFLLVCLASSQAAHVFPSFGLPIVTGYLSVGILVGPYLLALIPEAGIRSLRFVDELSFAFIAFSAGTALRVDDVYRYRRSIAFITTTIAVVEYVFGSTTIFALSAHIPFTENMPTDQVISVALLAGALVVARSPATVIAIVKEISGAKASFPAHLQDSSLHSPRDTSAKAPTTSSFAKIIVGVTVLMDLVVIVMYALTSLVCSGILASSGAGHGHGALQALKIMGVFAAQMLISSCCGIALALIMPFILWTPQWIKSTKTNKRVRFFFLRIVQPSMFLGSGFVVFPISHLVDPYLEPLIVCLVAGFIICNRGDERVSRWLSNPFVPSSSPRSAPFPPNASSVRFLQLESSLAEFIHVIFFTLTGAALSVNALLQNALIGAIIVSTRIVGLMIGAYVGGTLAKQPAIENKLSWMAYVTQAGVALGLAKKVHLEYKVWGGDFATMIVAVVVINQVIGPPLCKWVLTKMELRRKTQSLDVESKRETSSTSIQPDSAEQTGRSPSPASAAANEDTWQLESTPLLGTFTRDKTQ